MGIRSIKSILETEVPCQTNVTCNSSDNPLIKLPSSPLEKIMRKLPFLSMSMLMTACLTATKTEETDTADTENSAYATIADIQSGVIAEGETVTIQNAVITTSITGDEEGFFIQDEGGGEWSGIYVFVGQAGGGIAPIVGDKMTITGSVSEFYDSTQLVVSSAEAMKTTGEADPVPTVLTAMPADWESYEGCLVELTDQEAVSDVNSYGEVELSFGIQMDDLFFSFDTEYGAQYDSVVGVMTYSFEEFKINPRFAADLAGYVEGAGPEAVTVSDVQSGDFENRSVMFENVVVTEATSEDDEEMFWIQDEGGGEWSGLYVFVRANTAAEIEVARGDVVSLSGSIAEFYDQTQLVLEDASDFTLVSSGADTSPVTLSTTPADWENYESVLISLENVEIGAGGDYGVYELVNYPGIQLDDELFRYNVATGDDIALLTGLVSYSYGEFKINPRDADDMSGQVDNGGGDAVVATITELRDGTVTQGSTVTLESVVVTNVGSDKIYVQDPAVTENGGMLLFGTSSLTATVGDEITVTGEITEFYDLLEIVDITDFSVTGTGTVIPVLISAAPSDWEVYESMLVEVAGVTVASGPDSNGNFGTDWDITLSDYWNADLATGVEVDSSYEITGIVNYFSGNYELLTRDNSDIVGN